MHPTRTLRAHDLAESNGQAGYLDPDSGLFVMTAAHHRERGNCCGTGCRHCPFPPDEQLRAGRQGASNG